jgi:BirA family transcriptional regulator, biotin operon repressor / biotin---[acetyl-CoA-carboxylase] ligase
MVATILSRRQHFPVVGSTNDVVRDWLRAGVPEVCLAVADVQTAGRGREGRSWTAPSGTGLLASLGFRPRYLRPDQAWRLAAVVSLAMADAAEAVAQLPGGTVRLKWPNDLAIEAVAAGGGQPARKVAGVLGETEGLGTAEPRAVVGIGVNVDWEPADFPPELSSGMTSLREAAGRPIERTDLLEAFLVWLESRLLPLREGDFDTDEWAARQLTTGRVVELELPDGRAESWLALGVDGRTGALLVADDRAADGRRSVLSGEIVHTRVAFAAAGV